MPGRIGRAFPAGSAGAARARHPGSLIEAKRTMSAKIARIETFPLTYPTKGRFKFFEGPRGEPLGRQTVVVRITADNGAVGWGQSVPTNKWSYETLETVQTTIDRYLAPVVVGQDVFDSEGIQAAMDRIVAPSFSTGQPICKAGVDLALFDLTGRLRGETAGQRWGRRGRDRILMSWTLNPLTLDDIPRMIEEGRERGYRHFNVKVAPDPKFDLELCRAVKRLVPDGFLWADANGGYDLATALDVLPKLADIGVPLIEQPLKPNRITGYQRLRKQGALPIIMDEGVVATAELEEFIRLGMLDGVAMKPARCSGLSEARRQIEMLLDRGLMFLGSGLTDPDLSLAASLLLYGAYDLDYPAALNGPQFLTADVLEQPLHLENGQLHVPDGPGLGIRVSEEKVVELMTRSGGDQLLRL